MIIALVVWIGAHVGLIVAPPVVINAVAIGSLMENASSYYSGQESVSTDK